MEDLAASTLPPSITPICAIGASAGGVAALRSFFRQIDEDLGFAYVVIMHLSPDHPSSMDDILATYTKMPVQQVEDSPTLKPNNIYVIPPGKELIIEGNDITARPFTQPRGQRAPIDGFFRSIAAGRGDGLAVILTGSGSDGALGVRAVKEAGGVIFVQEPSDAEYPMMPSNAIATGVADFVAPIPRLVEHIREVAKSKEAVRSITDDQSSNELRRIVTFMRARTGHDFSSYKRATVMRRVGRRMQVARCESLSAYAEYVRATPEEAQELFGDLLISVTMFFRDGHAFEKLVEHAIVKIFDELADGGGIRAWTVGCATGEEAYSLAILFLEEAARRKIRTPIQIFATDLDEGALATAREGRYPKSVEADVSEERLHRWFIDEGTHYRIHPEVRDVVLFATHSVLKDPPFMRLDLITCRNLLIYLERALQRQLAALFHYGLKPHRFLFLGSAETADVTPELFAAVDREARIYCAKTLVARQLPQIHSPLDEHRTPALERRRATFRDEHDRTTSSLHIAALERLSPPTALVDESRRIINLSPSAGAFILHSGGPFTAELPAVVRPELRLDLKIALEHAFEQRRPTLTLPVLVAFDDAKRRVAMHVMPTSADESSAVQALVFFMDGGQVEAPAESNFLELSTKPDETRRLYDELKIAHERLSASRQEHDTATQDLRAANEELQSINEEYRSTAEELETSKEELQSMNEELQTVNAELKAKLESISSAHSDLQNLTSATEIGTLFLDPELRIRMFTPPVAHLFNITDADVGRAITDFTHRLVYDDIGRDLMRVLRELAPVETIAEGRDGRSYMMRIRPYRTIENRTDGIVVTFVDITARREAEQQLRESEERYRTLFDSIDEGFCIVEVIFDKQGKAIDYLFLTVNAAFEKQTGLKAAAGKTMLSLVPEHEGYWFEIYGRVATGREPERFEHRAAALGRFYEVFAFPVGTPEERKIGILFKDITLRKDSEAHLKLMVDELNHRVKNTLAVVQAIAHQTFKDERVDQSARRSFEGRLTALAAAHGLLTSAHWERAALHDIAKNTALGCGVRDKQFIFEGPEVNLQANQAVSIAMALHELCTNAMKYGSLSTDEGHVRLSWSISVKSKPRLRIEWAEIGGPPVKQPARRGFGSLMVEQALASGFDGNAKIDFRPTGVICIIDGPLHTEQKRNV